MLTLKIAQHCLRRPTTILHRFYANTSTMLSKELENLHSRSTGAVVADELAQNIKSATDTLDLFDALSRNDKKIMSSDLVMQSLKTLFVLQKSGNSSLQTSQILNHPQFEKICRDLRSASRSLETNDVVEALKVLSYLGVPSDSNIVHILLNMLRRQINDLSLGHIMFMEFLLKKFKRTPLVEALQIALPMLLQVQLSSQIDHENVPELIDLLTFAANNRISDKCVVSMVSALTLHGDELKPDEAAIVIWALCEIENYKPTYDRLLRNCFNVVRKGIMQLPFNKVDMIVNKTVYKYLLKFEAFYNEDFLNAAVRFAIENDIGFTKSTYLLKKFNKINFISIPLLDYIISKVSADPTNTIEKAGPSNYLNFIFGFSIADYIPQLHWDTIKPYILRNPILTSHRNDLPWLKVALELLAIDCFDRSLIEKIFDEDFLDEHLAREQNTLDYIQMLTLYQCVRIIYEQSYLAGIWPTKRYLDKAIELNCERCEQQQQEEQAVLMKTCLEKIFGGAEFVGTKISTRFGHLIDHVLVFDRDQRPIAINIAEQKMTKEGDNNGDVMTIDELKKDDRVVVAVMNCRKSYYGLNIPRLKGVFRLRQQILQALGVQVAAINIHRWADLPSHERLSYLEREIRYFLKYPTNRTPPAR